MVTVEENNPEDIRIIMETYGFTMKVSSREL